MIVAHDLKENYKCRLCIMLSLLFLTHWMSAAKAGYRLFINLVHSSKHTLNKFLFLVYIHWKSFFLYVGSTIVYIKLRRQWFARTILNPGENVCKNDIYAHYFQYLCSYPFLGIYLCDTKADCYLTMHNRSRDELVSTL